MSTLLDVTAALKHLPGQHDQKSHGKGGKAGGHLAKLEMAVAADKNVKRHVGVLSKALDGLKFRPGVGGRHPYVDIKGDARGDAHNVLTKDDAFKHAGG